METMGQIPFVILESNQLVFSRNSILKKGYLEMYDFFYYIVLISDLSFSLHRCFMKALMVRAISRRRLIVKIKKLWFVK